MVAANNVRQLSCSQLADATVIELPSIWKFLKKISVEKLQISAEELLNVITKFSIISSLFVLKPVIFKIKILSEIFQEDNLCYDQKMSSLSKFKRNGKNSIGENLILATQ